MSILELEELADIPDTLPYCPVKAAEMLKLDPWDYTGGPFPEPRWWQYRVCGIDQVISQ